MQVTTRNNKWAGIRWKTNILIDSSVCVWACVFGRAKRITKLQWISTSKANWYVKRFSNNSAKNATSKNLIDTLFAWHREEVFSTVIKGFCHYLLPLCYLSYPSTAHVYLSSFLQPKLIEGNNTTGPKSLAATSTTAARLFMHIRT